MSRTVSVDSFSRVAFGLLALAAWTPVVTSAQTGSGATTFWFAPPDVTDIHDAPGGEPIYLRFAGSGVASTVTVDMPANLSFNGGVPVVFTVPGHGGTRNNFSPFKSVLETRPTNTIVNSGLRITATAPVTVSYDIDNAGNAEAWSLKGPAALGQEFYIPLTSYAPFANDASYAPPHQAFASFDIVATEPDTLVTMFAAQPLDGHPALQQFSVMLDRGQTYSGGWTGANWAMPFTHPSGAVVISTKPIAVSVKDDSVQNPAGACRDLIGDQIVPVDALGQDYIAVRGALNSAGDESVFILATQNNTAVFRDGDATPLFTMFAGETQRIDIDALASLPNFSTSLHATKPVYATHVSGVGCEMGSALLPAIDRGGSRSVDVYRADAQSYIVMIIARTATLAAFTVSGVTGTVTPDSFVVVPGTNGEWSAARLTYNTTQVPVDSVMRIENALGRFHVGVLNGGSATSVRFSYRNAFVAPAAFDASVTPSTATVTEPGDEVTYTVRVQNTGATAATLTALVDDTYGDLSPRGCATGGMIAGDGVYTCTFTATVVGNAATTVTNTVTASGTSRGVAIDAMASATVTVTDVLPEIDAVLSASPNAIPPPGGSVTFHLHVSNESAVEALTLVSLEDAVLGSLDGEGTCKLPATLPIGGAYDCSYIAPVAGDGGDAIVRLVSATAHDDESNLATALGQATVIIDGVQFGDGFE